MPEPQDVFVIFLYLQMDFLQLEKSTVNTQHICLHLAGYCGGKTLQGGSPSTRSTSRQPQITTLVLIVAHEMSTTIVKKAITTLFKPDVGVLKRLGLRKTSG